VKLRRGLFYFDQLAQVLLIYAVSLGVLYLQLKLFLFSIFFELLKFTFII
jgi:hypothetical protein